MKKPRIIKTYLDTYWAKIENAPEDEFVRLVHELEPAWPKSRVWLGDDDTTKRVVSSWGTGS